jgi:hypothetical protein
MNWTAKIRSRGLRPGATLLLSEPEDDIAGQLAVGDTITLTATVGGSTTLKVVRANAYEILLQKDSSTWRLSPTQPDERQSGFRRIAKCSEWTIRARSK